MKRSIVSISEGIRQNLDNQKKEFIEQFFTTIQLIMAGNDSEGIAYGAIGTKEKYFLKWKEINEESYKGDKCLLDMTEIIRKKTSKYRIILDRHAIELLNKERLLEIIHDFIVYDRGEKKICRHNQYFGVKAAQSFIKEKEGGIIWHTQGSGKSLTMVWLTKWIRGNLPNARVLIITDREELDEQIEKVFMGVNEKIYRTKSGRDLLDNLNNQSPWLLCSLIHKFGGKDEGDVDQYIDDLRNSIPRDFSPKGDFFVFVDECHRTQSGKLHKSMKQFLPDAIYIGFTGTPLLKKDKATSMQVFGRYIHTYKFDEAVKDGVVLDLRYEARDVEQKLTSEEKIDEWFDVKTRGLKDYAKDRLKEKWGTLKKVFSARDRLEKIVMDIVLDMARKERLQNGRGNALLVSDSILNACRYYEYFQKANLKKCAIITSYTPHISDIKGETTGEGDTENIEKYETYKKMIADYFSIDPEQALVKKEKFEEEVKRIFVEEPARMKLLIVVNKLLTGFDAPPATYLYLDNSLHDHGLFQAVCRVNRLDGEDKEYGYIVDYKNLFHSIENSFYDFTSGAFDEYDKDDIQGLLKDRLIDGKEKLDDALEAIHELCEPVDQPRERSDFIHYFCGSNTLDPDELKNTEPRRFLLYKLTMKLIRAYTAIADEMEDAGYTKEMIEEIKNYVSHYEKVRKVVMLASEEYVDLKTNEPAMRQLIDNYVGAEESTMLANFDDLSLVEMLAEKGEEVLINNLPDEIKHNEDSMAETIEMNIRKKIVEENPLNPMYYDKMSKLLDEIIKMRIKQTIEYKEYLKKLAELSKKVVKPSTNKDYPVSINTQAKRSFYDNLENNIELAIELDTNIRENKEDGWRDHTMRLRRVKLAISDTLEKYEIKDDSKIHMILEIAKNQKDY